MDPNNREKEPFLTDQSRAMLHKIMHHFKIKQQFKAKGDSNEKQVDNRGMALAQEFENLVKAAGIERDLEELEGQLNRMKADWFSRHRDHPYDAWHEARKKEDEARSNRRYFGLRRIIFGVKDEDLRKKLIADYRKIGLRLTESHQEKLRDKERELDDLRKNTFGYGKTVFVIGAGAIVYLAASSSLAEGLGVFAFILIGTLFGMEHEAAGRRVAIREKAAEVAKERSSINELFARQVFTQQEEETGISEKTISGSWEKK
jgi:hypothetical protein